LGGKVEEALIGGSVLDNSFGFAIHGQNDRSFGPLQSPHHLYRVIAKSGKRLNVSGNVEHRQSSGTGILTYLWKDANRNGLIVHFEAS
jgi:hypothetical protein